MLLVAQQGLHISCTKLKTAAFRGAVVRALGSHDVRPGFESHCQSNFLLGALKLCLAITFITQHLCLALTEEGADNRLD